MKKNKLLLFSLMAVTTIGLASCGGEPSESTTSNEDSNTTSTDDSNPGSSITSGPVTPPSYDEDAIWFHYYRPEADYDDWGLWLWEHPTDGSNDIAFDTTFEFNGRDDFGMIAAYPTSLWSDIANNEIGLIVKKGAWVEKDTPNDIFFSLNDFEKDSNNIYHVYIVSGDATLYKDASAKYVDIVKSASFISTKRMVVTTNNAISSYKFFENETLLKEKIITDEKTKMADCNLTEEGNFDSVYKVEITFLASKKVITQEISTQPLFKTDKFDEAYTYDGELGAIYTKDSTTFKVWSPVSSEIILNVYDNGTPKAIDVTKGSDTKVSYPMTKGEKGVFSAVVEGDLNGKYYTYTVTNKKFSKKEIVDPYAKAAGVNGLRGMIVDFNDERALPTGWSELSIDIHQKTSLTVYETHVADVTSSESWTGSEDNRLLYDGMIESGTTYTEGDVTVKTGFDHMVDLGINAVQILPIFDQDNDEINKSFNWGYNPLNYNVIEGTYSKDPYDGYVRIKEFRNLVKKFADNGINVIMDVVYNHVSSLEKSNFNVLMPGYYFRYSSSDTPSSGSGCGNDTASEMPMMRKFIKDSTLFLAETYKLSGYRFDLMGLHDVETMNQVVENLKTNYNNDIVVYGEPWTMGTATSVKLANQGSMGDWNGFAGFNDGIRDGIKGSVFDKTSTGWATSLDMIDANAYYKVSNSILGYTPGSSKDPSKNVSYVSCHDNNTLYDKLQLSVEGDDKLYGDLSVLSNALVFTSQGISFMNAGEELLRSKVKEDGTLDENSYQSSYKTNELDYSRLIDFKDVYQDYQKLIEIKQTLPALHYETVEDVAANVSLLETNDTSYIDYALSQTDANYRIVHVSGYQDQSNTLDLSSYELVFDSLNTGKELSAEYQLLPAQTLILKTK